MEDRRSRLGNSGFSLDEASQDFPVTMTGESFCEQDDVTKGLSFSDFPSGLTGDYYVGDDDVKRGVTLQGSSFPGSLDAFSDSFFKATDPYGGEQDVCRGVSLTSDIFPPGMSMAPFDPFENAFASGKLDMQGVPTQGKSSNVPFEDHVRPLPKPADSYFSFDPHTFKTDSDRCPALMNCFLDFLHNETSLQAVNITKVNPSKCCIKSDVWMENLPKFTVKVKCYQQDVGLALEVQKRCGDSIAFAGFYRAAAKHIQQHFIITAGLPQESFSFSLPPPLPLGEVDVQDFGPLLDMASSYSPDLQAESAAALASLTADQAVADALCLASEAIEDIFNLLEPDCIDVALHAGTLMSNLARSHKAEAFLCENGYGAEGLQKLLNKVRSLPASNSFSNDASTIAKQKFAEAFAAATKSCAQRLHRDVAEELKRQVKELVSASENQMGYVSCIDRNLHDAYSNLCPVH
jgi:hypothetical protein